MIFFLLMMAQKPGPEFPGAIEIWRAPMNDSFKDFNTALKTLKGEKLSRIIELMKTLADEKFTGYIKVNFSQGGIGRIEKFEEILK